MNPVRSHSEKILTSALYQLRSGKPPGEVAAYLESTFPGVEPGEGDIWVGRARATIVAGQRAEQLLPGESIGQVVANPLAGNTVLVNAVAAYGPESNRTYRTIRVRADRNATMDSIRDLINARAAENDSPDMEYDADAYVGAEITNAW